VPTEIKRKLVLLGDAAVGKTSLVRRFVYNQFSDEYVETIGTRVSKKNMNIDVEGEVFNISLVIWDVLGQQDYTKVQQAAFRGADGALFVCDLTRKKTLESILYYWIPTLQTVVGVPGVLLANKRDLGNWEITEREIKEFSKITGLPYFLTSAKTGENVDIAFAEISKLMLQYFPVRTKDETNIEIKNSREVLDYIIRDFCTTHGNWNEGMSIIEANVRALGIDIKSPEPVQLRALIDKLYKLELYSLGESKAREKMIKRLGVLHTIESKGV